jgi:hypothetical protein
MITKAGADLLSTPNKLDDPADWLMPSNWGISGAVDKVNDVIADRRDVLKKYRLGTTDGVKSVLFRQREMLKDIISGTQPPMAGVAPAESVKAAAEEETDPGKLHAAAGAGAVLGGGLLTKNMASKGHLTGRETMYHGTDSNSARNIRRQGLMPTSDTSAVNTDALKRDPERYQKALGKTYATNSKLLAKTYAAQTAEKRNYADLMDIKKPLVDPDVVKIKAPTWKFNSVMNPEVDMPIREWFARSKNPRMPDLDYDDLPAPARAAIRAQYNSYRKNRVFTHAIPAEFIKGEKYKRLGMKELGQYIANNKLRFGKGMAGAGAGIGLAGLGAGMLAKHFTGAGEGAAQEPKA